MIVLIMLLLICAMDCNKVVNNTDFNLKIHLLGMDEKSTITHLFLRYNGTTIRVNLTITYFNIDEAFVFYSKEEKLNRSTIDVMCSSEPLMFPLPRGFIAVELRSMTCYMWSEYAEYLQNNYKMKDKNLTNIEIYVNTVKRLKWKSLVVFYENKSQFVANKLVENLSSNAIQVLQVNVDHLNDSQMVEYVFRAFKETENMTLICYNACTERIMKLVNRLASINSEIGALVQHRSKWLILSQECNTGKLLLAVSSNVTNVALIEPDNIYIDVCQNTKSICINEMPDQVICERSLPNNEEIEQFAKATTILFIYKIYSTERHRVHTLIYTKNGRELLDIGTIQNTNYSTMQKELFPNTKFGFNKRTLLVSILEWQPYNVKHSDGNYTGFTMVILERLAKRLNFTFKIVEPEDGEWGVRQNGKWTGMIGLLQQKRVDLVAAPMTVTFERSQVADFLYPIFFDTNRLVIKRPDQDENKWRTLTDIYSVTVLILIGVSLVFSTGFLCFVENINPYYMLEKNREKSRLSTISDCFWYNYGALLTQGGTNTPDAQTGRTVLSYWWIFCMVSMAIYSGNLVAFLTVSTDKLPFTTMAEMVKQKNYKWGLYGGGAMDMFFSQSTLQIHREVWKGIVDFNRTDPNVLSTSEDRQYNKVMHERYAYVAVSGVTEYYKAKGMDLVFIPEIISTIPNAFAVQKNSPYEEMFSREIMRMHESGLLDLWLKDGYPNNRTINSTSKFKAKTITLADVQSAFYLVGIGVTSGVITWILENVFHGLRKCQAGKTTKSVTLHRMQSFDNIYGQSPS